MDKTRVAIKQAKALEGNNEKLDALIAAVNELAAKVESLEKQLKKSAKASKADETQAETKAE